MDNPGRYDNYSSLSDSVSPAIQCDSSGTGRKIIGLILLQMKMVFASGDTNNMDIAIALATSHKSLDTPVWVPFIKQWKVKDRFRFPLASYGKIEWRQK
jgi:hypothetical protein